MFQLSSRILMLKAPLVYLFLVLLLAACSKKEEKLAPAGADLIDKLNNQLTEAIIQDGFNPPVASRIYAYCNIAASISYNYDDTVIKRFVNNQKDLVLPGNSISNVNKEYVLLNTFCLVAKNLVYRDYLMDTIQKQLEKQYFNKLSQKTKRNSIEQAKVFESAIIDWSSNDNYKKTRNLPRFNPSNKVGKWQPTPPSYGNAIEPYWHQIRPFILDSISLNRFNKHPVFSDKPDSKFYKAALAVIDSTKIGRENYIPIAKHWDCNPLISNLQGHYMGFIRQLTPGGHWIGITQQICRQEKKSLGFTTKALMLTSIALADAFISSWDTKYKTNLIRPETYINKYIDPSWKPILETPQFPEHTSGHSVISRSAASILTNLFGENYAFVDSVNVNFGLAPRNFASFYDASDEAAISRIYGGIHYPSACFLGIEQGEFVGNKVIQNLLSDN